MNIKNETASLLYSLMLNTTCKSVAHSALKAMDAIQADKVEDQLLSIAAVLICLLNNYKLDHVDVLGIAHNMVYSGENNNMKPEFKVITNFMKNEWEIL